MKEGYKEMKENWKVNAFLEKADALGDYFVIILMFFFNVCC